MSKTTSTCCLCGKSFLHYISQPKNYCADCLQSHRTKTCIICGSQFTRYTKEPFSNFLSRNTCFTCINNSSKKSTEEESKLFQELILGSRDCLKTPPPSDILEEACQEACAYFRLYYLYSLLLEYNDNTPLEERLPSTQNYLLDILRRIKNLNELLGRSKTKRTYATDWYYKNRNKTEPTDEDIKEIELEFCSA